MPRRTSYERLQSALETSLDLTTRRGFQVVNGIPLRELAEQAEYLVRVIRRTIRTNTPHH